MVPAGAVPHAVVHLTHPEVHVPGYSMPDAAARPPTRWEIGVGLPIAVLVAVAAFWTQRATHGVDDATVAWPWVLPFVLLLGCIAVLPFVAGHVWERHYGKVAVGLGLVVAAYYAVFVEHGPGNIGRAASEYVSFIYLLGSLFVVSGGILIRVRARATPTANAALLLTGAVVANVFGTTGASMLLIRPFLRMNRGHLRPYHVIFFIFVVSNTGGCLTPIGDPPLFLGYLSGVPFFWVFWHCWPVWLVVNGLLLAVFGVIDTRAARTQRRAPYRGDDRGPAVSLYGATNLLFVGLIVAGILLHSVANDFTRRRFGFEAPWRELLMAVAAFGSLATTPHRVHGGNHFNYVPIKEVAYLFAGIFLTMTPALNYLSHHAGALGLSRPGHYYFTTGGLSGVLDNAPTYLTFLKTETATLDPAVVERATAVARRGGEIGAADVAGLSDEQAAAVRDGAAAVAKSRGGHLDPAITANEIRTALVVGDPRSNPVLVGISMGAVLFGAMTYIGNGPNFMVRSIAAHAGVEMPGFFRYVYAFSLPILLPILVLVWLLFLR